MPQLGEDGGIVQVMDLEARVEQLNEELRAFQSGKPRAKADASELLPKGPAKHTLQGHRGTAVNTGLIQAG